MAFSEKMIHDTPIETLVEFLHALEVHDESEGLAVLAKIPTMIACGDHDLLTPVEYSREMAAALPKCELVIVGGAGTSCSSSSPMSSTTPCPVGGARHAVQARHAHATSARPGPPHG